MRSLGLRKWRGGRKGGRNEGRRERKIVSLVKERTGRGEVRKASTAYFNLLLCFAMNEPGLWAHL